MSFGYASSRGGYALEAQPGHAFPCGGHTAGTSEALKALSRYDFRTPVAQEFPATAAGLAAKIGGGALASHIWKGTKTDLVGSADLSVESGTVFTARSAVGLYDGASMVGHAALEVGGSVGNGGFATATLRPSFSATDAIAILAVFRATRAPASSLSLAGCLQAANHGFALKVAASGQLVQFMGDGATSATSPGIAGFADGGWHVGLMRLDRVPEDGDLWTDQGDELAWDFSSIGAGDGTATTRSLSLGLLAGVLSNGLFGHCPYLALFEDAEARKLTGLGDFWTHGQDPTRRLTTAIHASLLSVPVAPGYVSHYSGSGVHGQDHVPLEYDPDLIAVATAHHGPNPLQLGVRCNGAVTNFAADSEDYSGDTEVSGSPAALNAESPDGTQTAARFTQTALGGYQERLWTGLAALTEYHGSEWLWTDDGGHDCLFEVRDGATNTTVRASATLSLTDLRVRRGVTFTTGAGETSVWVRVYGGTAATSAADVLRWGRQINTENYAKPYVRTMGTSASSAVTQYNELAAGLHSPRRGELLAVYTCDVDAYATTHRTVMNCIGATAARNTRMCRYEPTGKLNVWVYPDSGGANLIQAAAHDESAEVSLRAKWDTDGKLPGGALNEIIVSGDDSWANQDFGSISTDEATTRVYVGGDGTARPLNGVLALLESYNQPRQ